MSFDDNRIESVLEGPVFDSSDSGSSNEPNGQRWKIVQPTLRNTYFTIDQAETSACFIARNELDCIEESMKERCNKNELRHIEEGDIISSFFDRSSDV